MNLLHNLKTLDYGKALGRYNLQSECTKSAAEDLN